MSRWIPIALIAAVMTFSYLAGLWKCLHYETLRYHYAELTEYVNDNPTLTPFLYIGVCIAITSLSMPGRILFTLLGGFLFKEPWSLLYTLIGTTAGATLLFWAARTSVGDLLQRKAAPSFLKMEGSFNRNAASCMLFLRLAPLTPFWLANLAPAFFNTRLKTYIWTTLIGIVPSTFVLTQAGRGLGSVFETSDQLTLDMVFNTQVIVALTGLAITSLVPIAIKKRRSQRV